MHNVMLQGTPSAVLEPASGKKLHLMLVRLPASLASFIFNHPLNLPSLAPHVP
jgi:hypothetical protein